MADSTRTVALADSAAKRDSAAHDSARHDSTSKPAPSVPLPTTGTVVVSGLPSGGRVRVDGKVYDATGPITLEPGSHKIEALATGYDNFSTTFAVARGVQQPIAISMTKAVGRARNAEKTPSTHAPVTEPVKPVAASATCPDSPTDAVANANNVCYDDRPIPQGSPLVPVADDVVATRPSPSILLVKVGPDGAVQQVFGKQISNNTTFHAAALSYARTLTFKPAQKDGQPVKAWVEVMLRPTKKQQ